MLGIIVCSVAATFREIGTSIGRRRVLHRKESMYSMGFLNMAWGTLLVVAIAWVTGDGFTFSLASLPTFMARAILEVVLMYVTLKAIVIGKRSTVGFLRTLSIPLLVLVDLVLGYTLSTAALLGMLLIAISFILLFINHGIHRTGAFLATTSAVLAVSTISLFKYNITHYNSVGAEQGLMMGILLIYLFVSATIHAKENPLRMLFSRRFLLQSFAGGLSSALGSFAYLFAPASVITAARRAFAVLFSIVSGHYYFKEKHVVAKLVAFILIAGGIVLLAL